MYQLPHEEKPTSVFLFTYLKLVLYLRKSEETSLCRVDIFSPLVRATLRRQDKDAL